MDKAKLLSKRSLERDVELPGVGTIRMRALTRDEVMQINDDAGDDARMRDVLTLQAAVVDPPMTHDEVSTWLEVAPAGEYVLAMDAASNLSGVDIDAAKSGVSKVRRKRR